MKIHLHTGECLQLQIDSVESHDDRIKVCVVASTLTKNMTDILKEKNYLNPELFGPVRQIIIPKIDIEKITF
jgi:hypothetical protein